MKKVKFEDKYMFLNNSDLQISPEIQRKLDPIRVQEIIQNFDPKLANPIKVSYRDGKYNIVDGMHTRAALCGINGKEDFPIFCRVFSGITKEEEARIFAAQFGCAEDVSMIYKLRALEVAKDPLVLGFLKATRDSGFTIKLGSHSGHNGHIAAVCEAYKA